MYTVPVEPVEFNCLQCGECCRRLLIDDKGLRKGLPLLPEERHLFPDSLIAPGIGIGSPGEPGVRVISHQMTEMVCPHLRESRCEIWSERPVVCRSYPYMPAITQGGYVTREFSLDCTSLRVEAGRRHGSLELDEGSMTEELRSLAELSKITREAVENLGEAWVYDLKRRIWVPFESLKT